MPLKATQSAFAGALLDPEAGLPDGVVDPEGRPAPRRFAVYRNNVTVSLVEALATAFPVVENIVGPEFFAAMAREFVRRSPPSSPLLMFYGEGFGEFLGDFAPVAHLAYLPDVAELEQLRRQAYHAADAEPLGPGFLSAIAPENLGNLTLVFHPSVRILRSAHPVLSIWEWNQQDGGTEGKEIPDAPESILIARPAQDVEMRRLPPGGAGFLDALAAGSPLGEAAAAGAGSEGFDLTQNISGLMESRIITAYSLDGATP